MKFIILIKKLSGPIGRKYTEPNVQKIIKIGSQLAKKKKFSVPSFCSPTAGRTFNSFFFFFLFNCNFILYILQCESSSKIFPIRYTLTHSLTHSLFFSACQPASQPDRSMKRQTFTTGRQASNGSSSDWTFFFFFNCFIPTQPIHFHSFMPFYFPFLFIQSTI